MFSFATEIMIFLLLGSILFLLSFKYSKARKSENDLSNKNLIQRVEIDHLHFYKKTVQDSPNLFVLVDHGLQVVVANRAAEDFGWIGKESLQNTRISESSKLHFQFELKRILRDGSSAEGEIKLQKITGAERYLIYQIFPVRDDAGVIVGAGFSGIDVTAQREAEQEVNRQREFVEEVINAIPDALYVMDENHKFIYGNRVFAGLIQKNLGEYVGRSPQDFLPEAEAKSLIRYNQEVLKSGLPNEVEEDYLSTENRKRYFLSKRIPFSLGDGSRVLISIMRDFTERRTLEHELQVSRARQEEASRLATLGETAGGIAHEINNPLNVLVGVAELMKAKVEKDGSIDKEKLFEYCERIVKYSMRIAKIVRGLRSISRDASQDPFQEVPLSQVVEETLELCRHHFSSRGIELVVKRQDEELYVSGRLAQISQIIMNLINNARDAVEGLENPTVHIEVGETAQMGYIRVWDSGPGVTEEVEAKIMRPFFTTKPPGKGTGLGLSISKSIAIEHRGDLFLNKQISRSCFELHIPLAQSIKQLAS